MPLTKNSNLDPTHLEIADYRFETFIFQNLMQKNEILLEIKKHIAAAKKAFYVQRNLLHSPIISRRLLLYKTFY